MYSSQRFFTTTLQNSSSECRSVIPHSFLEELITRLKSGRSNEIVRRKLIQQDLTELPPRASLRIVEAFPKDQLLQRAACASLTLHANKVTGTDVVALAQIADSRESPVIESTLQLLIPKVVGRMQPSDAAAVAQITASLDIPTPTLRDHLKRLIRVGGSMRKRRIDPTTIVNTLCAFASWSQSAHNGKIEKECFHLLGVELGRAIDDLTIDQALRVVEAFAVVGNRHEILLHHLWSYFAIHADYMSQNQFIELLSHMYRLHYYDTDVLFAIGQSLPKISMKWTNAHDVANILRTFADARVELSPQIVHLLTCKTGPWNVSDLGEVAMFHTNICNQVLKDLVFDEEADAAMAQTVALYVATQPLCRVSGCGCPSSDNIEEEKELEERQPLSIPQNKVVLKGYRTYKQPGDWKKRRRYFRKERNAVGNELLGVSSNISSECGITPSYESIFKKCIDRYAADDNNEEWEELYTAVKFQPDWIDHVSTFFLPEEFEISLIKKLKKDSDEQQVVLTLEKMFKRLQPVHIPAFGPIFVLYGV